MRFVSCLLSLLLVLQLTHWPLAAWAASVNFKPGATPGGGSVDAEIPVNRIGKLMLTQGTAVIKGNVVDVVGIPANTTEKKNVLSGVVVKTDLSGSGSHGKISGLVYFRSGPSLTAIDDPKAVEYVDLNDGGVVSGHIVSINHDEVEIQDSNGRQRKFDMVDVKTIRSPKIFAFVIPITATTAIAVGTAVSASASKMAFTGSLAAGKAAAVAHAAAPVQAAAPHVGMSMAAKVAIGVAVAAGVATAIAVPVAVGVAANSGNRPSPNQNAQAINLFKILTTPKPPPPPPPPSSGP